MCDYEHVSHKVFGNHCLTLQKSYLAIARPLNFRTMCWSSCWRPLGDFPGKEACGLIHPPCQFVHRISTWPSPVACSFDMSAPRIFHQVPFFLSTISLVLECARIGRRRRVTGWSTVRVLWSRRLSPWWAVWMWNSKPWPERSSRSWGSWLLPACTRISSNRHIWIRHVTYDWWISHMNESFNPWLNHVTYEESCHVWISHVTLEELLDCYITWKQNQWKCIGPLPTYLLPTRPGSWPKQSTTMFVGWHACPGWQASTVMSSVVSDCEGAPPLG